MGKTLLLRWLFPSLVSLFLLVSPSEAAQLQFWRYETEQNRLSFTTQGGVQPQASLLSNPTRLVIDLPGTTLGNVTRKQSFGGVIREIRIGQFDAQTARIVVELADGYTLDPQMVQFRGLSPSEWTVQIPSPQPIGGPSSPPTASRSVDVRPQTPPTPAPSRQAAVQPRPTTSQTAVDDVEVRDDGIVLHTSGQMPQIEFKRSQDGTWMTVDVLGATLASQSSSFRQRVSKDGVTVSQVTQLSNSPPVVRVIMSTPNTRQNWEARPSAGGVAIWPSGSTPPAIQVSTGLATIQSIELQNQTYFVVKADQPLNYTHGWDRETGAYGITFFSAKLPENIQLPQREVGGPILSTRIRQEDPETFTLLVEPATRVKIGQPTQNSAEQLVFPMGINLASVPPVPPPSQPSPQPPANTTPPPRSPRPLLPPRQSPPSPRPLPFPPRPVGSGQPNLPQVPQGRVVVMIDPGHGGSDSGAVGVGGLREKDIVMPISQQVAQILEQNGVSAVMTRTDDRTVELEPRVQMANRLGATLFVSIHANAAYRAGANGIETFYYQTGYSLAGYIQNSILTNFNMTNRGVKQARFYVLRNTSMPSVLVEVGFVTNTYDASILADPAQRSRMAQAIAQGILQYLKAGGY
ncbi:N-acetylmuramoyl-L-alanine amidase [Capilliphycus salinus ALCB114379]|uniref:N-acetylmuramoyl-L-alanine amidase n=1 Tax=Capilliphycus salinus TaxID=2768948 RepID=UPI0039A6BD2C